MERYATGGVDTSTLDLDVVLAVVPGASAAKGGVRAVLQALAEARTTAEASAKSAAQGELGSAKAIEEAPKATSLTTITDEMNADPYHPDWQRYVGGEPRAVGADVVSGGAKGAGAAGSDVGKVVTVSKSRFPESAPHIEDAIDAGKPDTLTIDRANTASNRRDSLRGIETKPGLDRDEHPPAMFQEGGQGASVRHINPSDHRGAGACIGAQCRGLPNGAKVRIDVVY